MSEKQKELTILELKQNNIIKCDLKTKHLYIPVNESDMTEIKKAMDRLGISEDMVFQEVLLFMKYIVLERSELDHLG